MTPPVPNNGPSPPTAGDDSNPRHSHSTASGRVRISPAGSISSGLVLRRSRRASHSRPHARCPTATPAAAPRVRSSTTQERNEPVGRDVVDDLETFAKVKGNDLDADEAPPGTRPHGDPAPHGASPRRTPPAGPDRPPAFALLEPVTDGPEWSRGRSLKICPGWTKVDKVI